MSILSMQNNREVIHVTNFEEMNFMHKFAASGDFDYEVVCEQLRSLWTAYCLHYDLIVDTRLYDRDLKSLWRVLKERTDIEAANWNNFDTFDLFMCKYLI